MSPLTPSKVVAYLAVIFVVGGATGAVLTFKNTRDRDARPPSMEKVCSGMQDRLRTKLGLTEEQMKKLQPIFEQPAHDLRAVRSRAIQDTDAIICRAHQQIARELSPEQKIKLEEFDRERRAVIEHRIDAHATGKVP
jgi:hypothetical protein